MQITKRLRNTMDPELIALLDTVSDSMGSLSEPRKRLISFLREHILINKHKGGEMLKR